MVAKERCGRSAAQLHPRQYSREPLCHAVLACYCPFPEQNINNINNLFIFIISLVKITHVSLVIKIKKNKTSSISLHRHISIRLSVF